MRKLVLLLFTIVVAAMVLIVLTRFRGQHTFTFSSEVAADQSATVAIASELDPHIEDWPQWRGPARDGRAGSTSLLEQWSVDGPPLLWKVSGLGSGMSSVAVANDLVYTLGQRQGKVWLCSRNMADGSERWSAELGEGGKPNGTPTVDGDQVFAITREGKIVSASAATGEIIWTRDFVANFGGSVPTWGYSESPLVDAGRVICTPGADDALVIALDRWTGKTIWKSPLPEPMRGKGHDGAGYSSAVISHGAGVYHYVQMFGGGVIGVAAESGEHLWGYSRVANSTAVIPTPIVHDDFVFVSSGYGAGAALLKLVRTAAGLEPQEVYFHRGNETQNHHGGMVLVDGHVYLGHGHNRGQPLCLELTTGAIKWGPVRGPGTGSAALTFADGHLYFRYEDATMALVEASPTGYQLKSVFKIPSALGQSWPHPAIARKHLYLRDEDVLLCYDLAKPPVAAD